MGNYLINKAIERELKTFKAMIKLKGLTKEVYRQADKVHDLLSVGGLSNEKIRNGKEI